MSTYKPNQNIDIRRSILFSLLCAALLVALAGPAPVLAAGSATIGASRSAVEPDTAWAQFGFDTGRTSYNPFETGLGVGNAAGLRLAWSSGLPVDPTIGGMIIYGSPIYFGGRIYAGAADGLYGLDPATGAIIINYRT